ncbi:MAG TPA: hypothetical protein V6D05_04405 [Stenomitos sp.]
MTRQLDELRHWMSSLEPRVRLFENQPTDLEPVALDPDDEDGQPA